MSVCETSSVTIIGDKIFFYTYSQNGTKSSILYSLTVYWNKKKKNFWYHIVKYSNEYFIRLTNLTSFCTTKTIS